MLTTRAKRFLQRTGRSRIGGNNRSGLGFDKSKVKCYNYQNLGHFARECEKPKQPASGFTKPSAPRQSNHHQVQGTSTPTSSTALVTTNDDNYDWSAHAEEVAYIQNQAFMANIKEVDSNPFSSNCLSCVDLSESLNKYKANELILLSDLDKLRQANSVLKANEKIFQTKLDDQLFEIRELKIKILNQQSAIDSYITEIDLQRQEYAEAQSKILNFERKQSNLAAQTLILDELIHSGKVDSKSKTGIGYNAVPPPKSYASMPNQDEIKNFVPATSSVVEFAFVDSNFQKKEKVEVVREEKVENEKEKVEIEEIFETNTVDKSSVKPENFIITNEYKKALDKGKTKVDADIKILKREFNMTIKNPNNVKASKQSNQQQRFVKMLKSENSSINSVLNTQSSQASTSTCTHCQCTSSSPTQTSTSSHESSQDQSF